MEQLALPCRSFGTAFRNYFWTFALLMTASGLVRWAIGQIDSALEFLVWELIYVPVAAVCAVLAAWLKPNPEADVPRKPRILKSIGVAFAIVGGSLFIAWLLFR